MSPNLILRTALTSLRLADKGPSSERDPHNFRVANRTDTIRQDFAVNSRSVVAVDSSNGPAGGKDFETMTSGG